MAIDNDRGASDVGEPTTSEPDRAQGTPGRDYRFERFPDRMRRPDRYFDLHLSGQQEWYSRNAGKAKNWNNALAVIVLAAGALTSVIKLINVDFWVKLITAFPGGWSFWRKASSASASTAGRGWATARRQSP